MESLSRHTLQQIVHSSPQGILLVETRGPELKIAYVNPAYEDMSGYSANELVGVSWSSFFASDEETGGFDVLKRALGCVEPCDVTVPFVGKDGSSWVSELNVLPLRDGKGDVSFLLCQHIPMPTLKPEAVQPETNLLKKALGRARKKLTGLERTDPVTGLLSLDQFTTLLRRDLGVARRQEQTITVLVFEIVDLDVYRQTFGSNAADSCLRMIGAQVSGTFRRAGDLCARYGEAQIVAAIPGQEVAQVTLLAKRVAEKIRNLGLHNPRAKSGRYIAVRSGVAAAQLGVDDVECLLDRAKANLEGDAEPRRKSAAR